MFKERKWDLLLTDSGLFTFKRVLVSLEKVFSLHSTTQSIFPNAGFHWVIITIIGAIIEEIDNWQALLLS